MNPNSSHTRPRLAPRHVAEGNVAQEALAVARADCEGIVDGVHVDFRHSAIPPGEWEARAWWAVGADDNDHAGFLFPSEAEHCERRVQQPDDDRFDDDLAREKLSLPRAERGDRLTVESVVDHISDRRFDHRHDATVKLANLVLTRPTGEQVRPPSPMAFYGVTQLRDGPQRDSYDRLAERILREHGNPDPHNFEVQLKYRPMGEWRPSRDFSLSVRAALAIEEAERAWHKLREQYLRDDVRGQVLLRTALNQAVLAAFFQAKHELGRAEKLADAAAGNLEKGPAARRNHAWHDYANAMWAGDPTKSRSSIFKEMVIDGIAQEDERRSVLRSLLSSPLCPDAKGE